MPKMKLLGVVAAGVGVGVGEAMGVGVGFGFGVGLGVGEGVGVGVTPGAEVKLAALTPPHPVNTIKPIVMRKIKSGNLIFMGPRYKRAD
jgi:hypothetical protein